MHSCSCICGDCDAQFELAVDDFPVAARLRQLERLVVGTHFDVVDLLPVELDRGLVAQVEGRSIERRLLKRALREQVRARRRLLADLQRPEVLVAGCLELDLDPRRTKAVVDQTRRVLVDDTSDLELRERGRDAVRLGLLRRRCERLGGEWWSRA